LQDYRSLQCPEISFLVAPSGGRTSEEIDNSNSLFVDYELRSPRRLSKKGILALGDSVYSRHIAEGGYGYTKAERFSVSDATHSYYWETVVHTHTQTPRLPPTFKLCSYFDQTTSILPIVLYFDCGTVALWHFGRIQPCLLIRHILSVQNFIQSAAVCAPLSP
jgi:hypothetical protein